MKTHALLPALFAGLLAAIACSDDSNNGNPAPPDVSTGGKKPTAGSGNKAGNSNDSAGVGAGGSTGGAPDPGDGGEPPIDVGGQGQGGEPSVPQPECDLPERGKDGCYNCPTNRVVEEFLNRCTDGDIVEFDNAARLPLLEDDGSLPDLPN